MYRKIKKWFTLSYHMGILNYYNGMLVTHIVLILSDKLPGALNITGRHRVRSILCLRRISPNVILTSAQLSCFLYLFGLGCYYLFLRQDVCYHCFLIHLNIQAFYLSNPRHLKIMIILQHQYLNRYSCWNF